MRFAISPIITDDPTHFPEVRPVAAFNTGFMQNYLTVWQQKDPAGTSASIYGQFVNPDGRLNGIRFRIPPAGEGGSFPLWSTIPITTNTWWSTTFPVP